LGQPLKLLSKWPLLAAMHLARSGWHLVGWQINIVSTPGRRATRGGKLI